MSIFSSWGESAASAAGWKGSFETVRKQKKRNLKIYSKIWKKSHVNVCWKSLTPHSKPWGTNFPMHNELLIQKLISHLLSLVECRFHTAQLADSLGPMASTEYKHSSVDNTLQGRRNTCNQIKCTVQLISSLVIWSTSACGTEATVLENDDTVPLNPPAQCTDR